MDRAQQLIAFLKEAERLKAVERKVYCSTGRPESVAEHSWHLSLFVLLLEQDLGDVDAARMLKMAIMHDLVELRAGDTFFYDTAARESKRADERAAAHELFATLPPDLHKEFLGLFEEFEAQETEEARIVASLDKLQPILQNICSDGKGWREHNISLEEVDRRKRPHMAHPAVLKMYEELLAEAKRSIG